MPAPLTLTSTLQLSADRHQLTLSYRVVNQGGGAVTLLDRLVGFGESRDFALLPDKAITALDADGDVRFSLGYVPSDRQVAFQLVPSGRSLSPGATAEGELSLDLPLRSWHPHDGYSSLASASQAVLALGYLDGDVAWTTLPLESGGTVSVPSRLMLERQRWLVSEPMTLP